jgi:hypothetical protein
MIFDKLAESRQIERALKANFTSFLLTKYGENPRPKRLFNGTIVLYLMVTN